VDELQEALDRSIHERQLLELELTKRLRQAQESAAEAARETGNVLSSTSAERAAAIRECAALRERLAERKAELCSSLGAISGNLYEELKALPPESVSLRVALQVRVYELMAPYQEARRELEEMRVEAGRLASRAAVAGALESEASQRIQSLVSDKEELKLKLEEAQGRLLTLAGGSATLEAYATRAATAESELSRESACVTELKAALEAALEESKANLAAMNTLKVALETAAVEKRGLERELCNALAATRMAEDREAAAREALGTRELFSAQLTALVAKGIAGESDSALGAARLREERDKAEAELVQSLREGHAREVRELRESRDAALAEALAAKTKLSSATEGWELTAASATAALRTSQAANTKLECELLRCSTEMQASLTAKEEAREALFKSRAEVDALREKVALLQASIAGVEASASARVSSLAASLAVARVKLGEREDREIEYDDAILAAGKASALGTAGASNAVVTGSGKESGDERILGLPLSPPTFFAPTTHPESLQRRTAQAVSLARELWLTKGRVGELEAALEREKALVSEGSDDCAALKKILSTVSGPSQYIVSAMEGFREDVKKARKESVEASKAAIAASAVIRRLELELAGAKGEVESLKTSLAATASAVSGSLSPTPFSPSSRGSIVNPHSLPVGVSSPPIPSAVSHSPAVQPRSPLGANPSYVVESGGKNKSAYFGGQGGKGEDNAGEGMWASATESGGGFEISNGCDPQDTRELYSTRLGDSVDDCGSGERTNHLGNPVEPWNNAGKLLECVDSVGPGGGGMRPFGGSPMGSKSGVYAGVLSSYPPTHSRIQVRPLVKLAGSTVLPNWYSHANRPPTAH